MARRSRSQDRKPPPPPPTDGHGAGLVRPRKRRWIAKLRTYFLTGLVVTAPIGITFTLAFWVIEWIDGKVVPLIPAAYNPQTYLEQLLNVHVPGIGLIVVFVGLTLIGFLAAGLVGRFIVRFGEQLLNRMPVIRSVYGALKQIFETILESSSKSFREVVLVEYPRRGIWAVAFITGETEGEVQNMTADQMVNIFLPTTPNPTSGFLLFVPRQDLVSLSMSVEEGIKMVVSGGIVTPPDNRPAAERAVSVVTSEGAMGRELSDKGVQPSEAQPDRSKLTAVSRSNK